PDKVHTLYLNEIEEKMWPLPIGDLYGIGRRTREKLLALHIDTIGILASTSPTYLSKYFKNQAIRMIESANGIDNSIVEVNKLNRKGISNSTTLSKDLTTISAMESILHAISENVAISL